MEHNVFKHRQQEEKSIKLAMAQMSNAGTVERNLKKSIDAIRTAAREGADLILFPEVQLTEFFPQYPGGDATSYGLEIDSETVNNIRTACREGEIAAVPNIYLMENEKYYDASILIDRNGEIVGVQKMVHVAQAEQFYEKDYYTPSDTGFQVFDTEHGRIGIVVCFDRHYPESVRTESLMGADLILVPTVNTKSEPLEIFEWEIRIQAFQNSVVVAMCNRVGKEGEMDFAGESMVADACGNCVVKADDSEQIVYADIDMKASKRERSRRPYTTLRRKELYR